MKRNQSKHLGGKAVPTAIETSSSFVLTRFVGSDWTLVATSVALLLLQVLAVSAQTPAPSASPENPCPTALTPGQTVIPIPVIGSSDHRLRGTIILSDEQEWMPSRVPVSAPSDSSRSQCQPQYVRMFREYGARPTMASAPYGPYSRGQYALPRPGPTLRARVGDLVQLTFVNQINTLHFGDSIDRGETGRDGGCDSSNAGYPGADKFPDCFHGSSTGNIHFHGTHTSPNTTADNVFIEVRPSLREGDKPVVTPESVAKSFDSFFTKCEVELSKNVLREWPTSWNDLPRDYTDDQKKFLKEYDTQMEKKYGPGIRKLWPVNEAQIKQGAWPQYYIGAFPFCYRLPEYKETTWPPSKAMDMQRGGAGTAEMQIDPAADQILMMGQSPGTHWYHAHKHGSTALNVANGMTGAFIIEGKYDDELNGWYGTDWTRSAQVLVINQLGVTPNLVRGGAGQQDKGPDFSINGQLKPVIDMRPGEVQMWRIVNTSGRAGALFHKPTGFHWRQIAQDGVQFKDTNYQNNMDKPFLLAAGNRADLLVKAPTAPCANPADCSVIVQNEVDPLDLATASPLTLLTINVTGTPVNPTSNNAKFIPNAPKFPPFLDDIADSEVKGTKVLTFRSEVNNQQQPAVQHMIDGERFDGEVGAVVLLNRAEEWKLVNETFGGRIVSHPFHIHINPFQIVEVFSPNDPLIDPKTGKPPINPKGKPYIDPQTNKVATKYAFHRNNLAPGQCYLDPDDPNTWKPCDPPKTKEDLIWWDVFPIPSGYAPTNDKKEPIKNKKGEPIRVPGYFKMRSRFVDYTGFYVLHCHILAHEDRGMMTIVEVTPSRTPYSHH